MSSRENQVNQDSQEVLDKKELQEHQVFQVYLEVQDQRVMLACQDSKVIQQKLKCSEIKNFHCCFTEARC